MANVTVKALSTIAGSYGVAHAGDEVTVKASVAKDLEKAGLVEIVGDSEEDETVATSGSVRFTQEKNAAAGPPAEETDEANPTKEKKAAGPNAKRK